MIKISEKNDEDLDIKIEKILEKKLPEIIVQIEELKKKKESKEKERTEYVKKIWSYFPGAHTKELSFKEVKDIAEKLDELAKKVNYEPVLPRRSITKIFGDKKHRKKRIALIIFLIILLSIGVTVKIII